VLRVLAKGELSVSSLVWTVVCGGLCKSLCEHERTM